MIARKSKFDLWRPSFFFLVLNFDFLNEDGFWSWYFDLWEWKWKDFHPVGSILFYSPCATKMKILLDLNFRWYLTTVNSHTLTFENISKNFWQHLYKIEREVGSISFRIFFIFLIQYPIHSIISCNRLTVELLSLLDISWKILHFLLLLGVNSRGKAFPSICWTRWLCFCGKIDQDIQKQAFSIWH